MVKEEAVFENELRKMIYNHIVSYPGVSFNTLLNIFELTEGGLRYHLDFLSRCGKINLKMENGRRNYYPQLDITNINKALSPGFENNKLNQAQNRLLKTITLYPGITQKDLVFIEITFKN